MAKNKTSAVSTNQQVKPLEEQSTLFTRENYKWMLIGLVVMAIGFFLMAGGKSPDPNVFNDNEIYSFRRITLAPILIVAGLVIEIFAIIKKQK
jgi:FtsH-binding integral membrane protein